MKSLCTLLVQSAVVQLGGKLIPWTRLWIARVLPKYVDPHNEQEPFDKELAQYWMPVDIYIAVWSMPYCICCTVVLLPKR